jgi:hypothetical protein
MTQVDRRQLPSLNGMIIKRLRERARSQGGDVSEPLPSDNLTTLHPPGEAIDFEIDTSEPGKVEVTLLKDGVPQSVWVSFAKTYFGDPHASSGPSHVKATVNSGKPLKGLVDSTKPEDIERFIDELLKAIELELQKTDHRP